MNRQPLHLRRQHGKRGRRGGDFHLAGRKDVTAVRAFSRRKCDDAVAFRAELGWGLTATGLAGPPGPHQIDRPVAADIAGKIEDEAVLLARRKTRAASHHLHIEPRGFGGAQECDQVNSGGVEAGGQHAHRGQRADFTALERGDDGIALLLRCVAEDCAAGDALAAELFGHMAGVLDSRTEGQPGLPVAAMCDDLGDRGPGNGLLIDGSSQIALDEIACTGADLRNIEVRGGLLRAASPLLHGLFARQHAAVMRSAERGMRAEYPVLVLFACLGMSIMVSANDFMSLYLGLELNSLSAYVLAAILRRDPRSGEAGLKYFVLGALASGILLYVPEEDVILLDMKADEAVKLIDQMSAMKLNKLHLGLVNSGAVTVKTGRFARMYRALYLGPHLIHPHNYKDYKKARLWDHNHKNHHLGLFREYNLRSVSSWLGKTRRCP